MINSQLISMLPAQWYEYFLERAGILEYEAGMNREEAEELALEQTQRAILNYKRNHEKKTIFPTTD